MFRWRVTNRFGNITARVAAMTNNDPLPDPEQYERIRMAARLWLREAREVTDNALALSIDLSLEDERWAYRVHIYERDVDPEDRRHWRHEGTAFELEGGEFPKPADD
jgi:hypothetical protein